MSIRRAGPADALDRDVEQEYLVIYPSGQRLTQRGVLTTFPLTGNLHLGLRAGPALIVLDPRVLVVRGDVIIYDPRNQARLPAWVVSWLAEHPEWPDAALDGELLA
jgi:hypothetical protein